MPLYLRIVVAVLLGAVSGLLLGPQAEHLGVPGRLVLQLLSALAPAIVLVAVVRALIDADVGGRRGWQLAGLLVLNTVVAISIGLIVVNVLQPGAGNTLDEADAQCAGLQGRPGGRGPQERAQEPVRPLGR